MMRHIKKSNQTSALKQAGWISAKISTQKGGWVADQPIPLTSTWKLVRKLLMLSVFWLSFPQRWEAFHNKPGLPVKVAQTGH